MAYIIKRTEIFNGNKTESYIQDDGFFGREQTARIFPDWDDAEYYIECEQSDPKYDKEFMGVCSFNIIDARITNLQSIRRQRGLSQSELSRKAEVPLKTIQGYEGGKDINKAAALTVYKLAKALDVDISEILEI